MNNPSRLDSQGPQARRAGPYQATPGTARDSEVSRDPKSGPRRKLGPGQSKKGRDRYVQIFLFLRRLLKKKVLHVERQAIGT
jgi:hypothetical protein